MNINSISLDYKEKRSTIEVTIYHAYSVKNKKIKYTKNIATKMTIKKPTKKQLIKELKKL